MISNSKELLKDIEEMKSGLISYSCGASWDENAYIALRSKLLKKVEVRSFLPSFVVEYRNLSEFWNFIKLKYDHYSERRSFIHSQFAKLIKHLEFSDEKDYYSEDVKKKLLSWISESGDLERSKALSKCELTLIPTDGLFGQGYDVVIRAPRDIFIEFESDYSNLREEVKSAIQALLNHGDELQNFRVLALASSSPLKSKEFLKIQTLSSKEVSDSWSKLLDRIDSDIDGAITMSRTLIEGVCKDILDHRGVAYQGNEDLDDLYKKVKTTLSLAPENYNEETFKKILRGCISVVSGLASLRNALGDSHGKGVKSPKPLPRHARLAVNLGATMSLFLIETLESKKTDKVDFDPFE